MSKSEKQVKKLWIRDGLMFGNFITFCSGIMKAKKNTNKNTQKTACAAFKFGVAEHKNKAKTNMKEETKFATILSYICILGRDPLTDG